MRLGPQTGRMVVAPHRPWFRLLGLVLGGVLLLVVAGLMYYLGGRSVGFDRLSFGGEMGRLHEHMGGLEQERNALREKLAALEQTSRVDGEAYAAVREQLRTLQGENLELREEIAFYRGIVAPGEASTGLGVQSLEFRAGPAPRVFHYKLVLTQTLSKSSAIHGEVRLTLNGVKGGKPVSLGWDQVAAGQGAALAFQFKYFQKFEGDLALPEGFKPQSVQVVVDPAGKGGEAVTRRYDWSNVVAG